MANGYTNMEEIEFVDIDTGQLSKLTIRGEDVSKGESCETDTTICSDIPQLNPKANPRSILPTEVWISVFDHLNDSRDWLNSFYVSKVFREEPWLKWETGRVVHLFPEVLKICWEKYERFREQDNDSNDESNSDSDYERVGHVPVPISIPTTSIALFKNCRLVCKNWRKAVDNLLQGPSLCLPSLHTTIDINRNQYERFHNFVNYSLQGHITTNWNPFPSGELTICDEDDDFDMAEAEYLQEAQYIPEFQKDISRFLKRFGHHLKIFSHYGRYQQQYKSPCHWYTTIHNWIESMPNLQVLSLVYVEIRDYHQPLLAELEQKVQLNPFPKLPKLKTLHVEDVYVPVLNSAVENNFQVEKIILNRLYCRRPWITMGNIFLNNLITFYAKMVSMQEFYQLQQLNSPLEQIKVQMLGSAEMAECFRVLKRFHETLTFIDISLPASPFHNSRKYYSNSLDLRPPIRNPVFGGRGRDYGEDNSEVPIQLTDLLQPFSLLEEVSISPFNLDFYKRFRDQEFATALNLEECVGRWFILPLWSRLQNLKKVTLKDVSSKYQPSAKSIMIYYRPG